MTIFKRYIIFAILATAINISFQYITIVMYSGEYAILLSIFLGTIAGLFSKYILDKNYIFSPTPQGIIHQSKSFLLYVLMGGVTTLVYLTFEIVFEIIFQLTIMRYLGAVIGLSIGYYMKYQLDKKYVFVDEIN